MKVQELDEARSALAEALDIVADVVLDLREIAGGGWSREGCIARAKEALPKLEALSTTAAGEKARSRVHDAEAYAGNRAREICVLRARVAELEKATHEDASTAFRVGQVWESPNLLTYRIVGIQQSERHEPRRISMRRGSSGNGRLFVKRGESTFGWRLVTPMTPDQLR